MANNISGTIALTGLKSVFEKRKNKAGQEVECLIIPISANHLTKTEKGNVYMNISAWPRRTASQFENDKSTHIINQDPGKEIRDAMKAETPSRYPATLGSLTVWDQVQQGATEPQSQSAGYVQEGDDLPF